eukprot:gnl/MRDRNA2_/MRDRNA2_231025_c0_seq1.p1 gnl/MRDRNA2_/MRDRNA2_231025_c0~~gnl/MRDRNA2_/MRDRNA2_231025_c0_seq1.p1  ORF type:complete len:238 (-),score=53.38 gnl/MRDRNA2_/MRDRNA2_231025_c0_seq1:109-822(-)
MAQSGGELAQQSHLHQNSSWDPFLDPALCQVSSHSSTAKLGEPCDDEATVQSTEKVMDRSLSLTIRSMNGSQWNVVTPPKCTVATLKNLVAENAGISVAQQKLVVGSSVLDDDNQRVVDSGIVDQTEVTLVVQEALPYPEELMPMWELRMKALLQFESGNLEAAHDHCVASIGDCQHFYCSLGPQLVQCQKEVNSSPSKESVAACQKIELLMASSSKLLEENELLIIQILERQGLGC